VAGRNAVRILGHLAALDEFRLGLAALGLILVALVAAWREREKAFRYAALLLAVLVFCGGYAFIQAENPRYFWFVFFVLTVAAFHFVEAVPRMLGRLLGGRRGRRLVTAAVAAFAILFAAVAWYPRVFRGLRNGRAMGLMSLGAFVGPFVGVSLLVLALRHRPSGVISTFVATVPVLILPFMVVLYKERISLRAAAGACVAVGGVALLFL